MGDTMILYGAMGVACGIAWLRMERSQLPWRYARAALTVLFWPLLLPVVFQSRQRSAGYAEPLVLSKLSQGPYAEKIQSKTQMVREAITLVERSTEHCLEKERRVLQIVSHQLNVLDHRVDELDTLLAQPSFDQAAALKILEQREASHGTPASIESAKVQLQNIQKLQALKAECEEQLDNIIALLERVHSQLTLLRFTKDQTHSTHDAMDELIALVEGWEKVGRM